MEFRRPKIYFTQFLLIPVRIIVAVPLIIGFVLFLNVTKALFGLSGFLLLYGVVWLLDRTIWPGLLGMRDGVFVLLVIATYVLLFYGLRRMSDSQPIVKPKPNPPERTLYDSFFEFVFDAKYIEPAVEIYGPNFPKPTFEQFGLEAEQYYAYNRRFSLSGFEFPLTLFSGLIAGYFASKIFPPPQHIYVGFTVSILVCAVSIGFEQLNSRRYPQFYKVKNYNRAKKIYDSIEEHLRRERVRLKFNG